MALALILVVFGSIQLCTSQCITSNDMMLMKSLQEHLYMKNVLVVDDSPHVRHSLKHATGFLLFVVFDNVALFSKHLQILAIHNQNSNTMVVLSAFSLKEINTFFDKAQWHVVCSKFVWLILIHGNSVTMTDLKSYIPYDCLVIVANVGYDSTYILTEIYHVKRSLPSVIKQVGTWNEILGLHFTPQAMLFRRYNMNGTKLVMYKDTEMPCKNPYQCQHRAVWFEMERMLNYQTDVLSPSDFQLNKNLKVDGSILTLAFHAQSFRRDCVAPILKIDINMFLKRVEVDTEISWSAYVQPLNAAVWFSLGAWVLVSALLLSTIRLFCKDSGLQPLDCGFKSLESLCNQSGSHPPDSPALRIAYLATHAVASVILPVYSACVIAFFTVQLSRMPFNDLQGFVRDGSYMLSTVVPSFGLTLLETSTDAAVRTVAEQHMVPAENMPRTYVDAVFNICHSPRYAFLAFNEDLYHLDMNLPCDIDQLPRPVFHTFTCIPLADKSPYRAVFNLGLTRLYSSGVMQKITAYETSYELLATHLDQFTEPPKPISFTQVVPLLAILFCGTLLAGLIFSLEIIHISRRSLPHV